MTQPNFLVVLLDDLGPDRCSLNPFGVEPARLPFLGTLKRSGVYFPTFYSEPACSPSRSDMLTGRYPNEHKLGVVIHHNDTYAMDTSLPTWVRKLRDNGYDTALVGKHHLARTGDDQADAQHPINLGFGSFRGTTGNVGDHRDEGKWHNLAVTAGKDLHNTQRATAEAQDMLLGLVQPWAMVLNYHAPHGPYQHGDFGGHTSDTADDLGRFKAMAEEVDSCLGELWYSMSAAQRKNTWLLVASDNGSPPTGNDGTDINTAPQGKGKGTMYDGGVRTWLLAYHEDMPASAQGREHTGQVQLVDFASTILELAGLTHAEFPQSISFATALDELPAMAVGSTRFWAAAEKREPLGVVDDADASKKVQMLRGPQFKLIRTCTRHPTGQVTVNEKLTERTALGEEDIAWSEALAASLRTQMDAVLGGPLV